MFRAARPRGGLSRRRARSPAAPSPAPRLSALKPQVAADPDYLLSPSTKLTEGPWDRGEKEKRVKGKEEGYGGRSKVTKEKA